MLSTRQNINKRLIRCSFENGFTAIELAVTLAVLALLAGLATPSFSSLNDKWRVRRVQEDLQSTFQFARSEAVKRAGHVTVQKISNNTNGCTTAKSKQDWDCGWIVCADSDNSGSCGATEIVLQRVDAPGKVQVTRTGGGISIKFDQWGLVDGVWPGFSLVPLNRPTTHPAALGLCMSSGGRIRIIPPEAIPCRD
jgi:type IV fimbrial biogenesis protein FimT